MSAALAAEEAFRKFSTFTTGCLAPAENSKPPEGRPMLHENGVKRDLERD